MSPEVLPQKNLLKDIWLATFTVGVIFTVDTTIQFFNILEKVLRGG